MKVDLPSWLWALPGWLELPAPLVPTLTLLAFGLWEGKPGGVWDQYEARARERAQEKKQ